MSHSDGGSRGFGFNRRQPVKVDKEYEARIEDISRRGDGIARVERFQRLTSTRLSSLITWNSHTTNSGLSS